MTDKKQERVYALFEQYGPVLKTNKLRENKIFSRDIAELISNKKIRKIKTGFYIRTQDKNNMSDLEIASAIIPNGIICLQSAASYYDLTTINPISVYVAIPSNGMRPVLPSQPPIELVVTPARLFTLGISEQDDSQSKLRIYNKERTICDFFRKRNQIGEDIAIEVLRNYMQGKRDLQRLFEYAEQFRIKTVLKPYVEAMI
ncbi:hypothetical protein LJC56_10475 [Christensenellaceae bacterium OttesenSCG-928-K19]|nr:hypothetical protein [Christensenellaceae bacterium OttesenSCG-928-K19]